MISGPPRPKGGSNRGEKDEDLYELRKRCRGLVGHILHSRRFHPSFKMELLRSLDNLTSSGKQKDPEPE